MSRVERTENPIERRGQERRQTERRRIESPGRTPGKAEEGEGDVERALEKTPE